MEGTDRLNRPFLVGAFEEGERGTSEARKRGGGSMGITWMPRLVVIDNGYIQGKETVNISLSMIVSW